MVRQHMGHEILQDFLCLMKLLGMTNVNPKHQTSQSTK